MASLSVMIWGCASITTAQTDFSATSGYLTSTPAVIQSPDPASTHAQATIAYGQGQLLELSRKATDVSLRMTQAAIAAAVLTQDDYQRQKMDMDYQATVISRNITQAVATQEFIAQQTRIAGEVTVAAQNRSATAARSAYLEEVNQAAQAKANSDIRISQTAQALAALTTYPLTATPLAETRAALLMEQYNREERAFVDRVVAPLIPILAVVNLLLFFMLIFVVYRWILSLPFNSKVIRDKVSPLSMIEGVIADNELEIYRLPPSKRTLFQPLKSIAENSVIIEIVDASSPPIKEWIADVELQLNAGKGLSS